ncbi:MAG: 1-acyl-sn-glycerol-3-phosphate acyltransferase [Candidatus Cardinium sp.]|uniref:1-acyl-sn-glycerol-3-phosphate acyltransferase n=1 Tax=Cardinium endosymbiont of Dermatophagoides farinae TaxID=2597823 RepID=UPI001183B2B2|nr:1-acyl-sn-glycerol-3-phosphate acyltransferase [Cardinium endosymbiont of Dermatophagoides farinae]TSJ80749.1 glycerol-3-phosphate acyltransferase [Cardinium endosymbiont of Dermatophagoides farinae]UWW96748.1 MAG: 1-acyl-sn-glycerol-3-phosphate acyltransferase [Candidatus Cardinium sp.]
MSTKDQFMPIESRASRWPITILHKNQKAFLREVVDKSFKSLCARHPMDEALYRILAQTASRELARVASNPWSCDPQDDRSFWEAMASSIDNKVEAAKLLKSVIERYVREICSNFSVRHYQCISKGVYHTFVHLLKPDCFGVGSERWTLPHKRLQEKFHLMGATDTVRALAQIGTIVLVPTHTSNWDSVVVGLAMKQLGLPPLTWGAGLNLFNNKGFRYVFDKLGTYKVDRRKKTIPYLQVQKDYACHTLEWGCHTLFYPGGTRSRLGAIESDLKLGLLSTPFEAQEANFQNQGVAAKKLFIVPIVLNYHCVLEAYELVRESVQMENVAAAMAEQSCCATNFQFSKNILCKGSEIFVNIGTPLDVMGNRVDITGCSYDDQGQPIDLYQAFLDLPVKTVARKRSDDYVQTLSHKIVAAYHRINMVLSSHLVAFVAYELAKKRAGFSMQLTDIVIPYADFMAALGHTYKALQLLYTEKKIVFTSIVQNGQLAAIAKDGCAKLGVYHAQKPLVVTAGGDLLIQDLLTLFYYHNRLTGYGLEALI